MPDLNKEPRFADIQGNWTWGWNWPPTSFGKCVFFYDCWHYLFYFGFFYIGKEGF